MDATVWPSLKPLLPFVGAAIALGGTLGACNVVTGVDDLQFDLAGAGGTGGFGGDGGGGFGGDGCGPCDTPDTDCEETTGTCVNGACVYAPLDAGEPCDDGDGCTEGDQCDGQGMCDAGALCPQVDPCVTRTCMEGMCVPGNVADGTSCGPEPADRCCDGQCVDISSDPLHCGGCGSDCFPGRACETIAVTACGAMDANTTARCVCNGATSECPSGQVCRNVNPGIDRCAPEGPEDCPGGVFVDQAGCPNHCLPPL